MREVAAHPEARDHEEQQCQIVSTPEALHRRTLEGRAEKSLPQAWRLQVPSTVNMRIADHIVKIVHSSPAGYSRIKCGAFGANKSGSWLPHTELTRFEG